MQVVTFDGYGVSGHVNHRHTHRGVLHLMRTTQGSAQPTGAPAAQDAGTSTGGSKAGNASSLQGAEYYCLVSSCHWVFDVFLKTRPSLCLFDTPVVGHGPFKV